MWPIKPNTLSDSWWSPFVFCTAFILSYLTHAPRIERPQWKIQETTIWSLLLSAILDKSLISQLPFPLCSPEVLSWPRVVAHIWHISTGRQRQKDPEFKASLGCIEDSFSKTVPEMLGMKCVLSTTVWLKRTQCGCIFVPDLILYTILKSFYSVGSVPSKEIPSQSPVSRGFSG